MLIVNMPFGHVDDLFTRGNEPIISPDIGRTFSRLALPLAGDLVKSLVVSQGQVPDLRAVQYWIFDSEMHYTWNTMSPDSIIALENNLTLQFTANQAKILITPVVPTHYNLIVPFKETLAAELATILAELKGFSELTLSSIANCHMTVTISPDNVDTDHLVQTITTALNARPLRLEVRGMHSRAPGIFLNVYSPDGSLQQLRQSIATETNGEFDPTSRLANVGWITLARFSKLPSEELLAYVRANVGHEFGTINDMHPVLHQSNNSMRLGSVVHDFSKAAI